MIVYVNGDSHSAGAEAANAYCFLSDDPAMGWDHYDRTQTAAGRVPHPDNVKVSYGQRIADQYNATLVCQAESGSSNQRMLRTTYEYLETNPNPDLIIIGWATWEREEFFIDGYWHQFSANMSTDGLSDDAVLAYKHWVLDRHSVQQYCDQAQEAIWNLHQRLVAESIPHLFFNTFSGLTTSTQLSWSNSYYEPYTHAGSFFNLLKSQGYTPVTPTSYHYGADAHQAWANHLTKIINESIITT